MRTRWEAVAWGGVGAGTTAGWWLQVPFPFPNTNPVLDLIQASSPWLFTTIHTWWYIAPGIVAIGAGRMMLATWRVWGVRRIARISSGRLPPWPLDANTEEPAIVVGEVHHPIEARESAHPAWLRIPARGLYTGIAIFGAVGSGKTSACMRPFAQQLFSWQAADRQKRCAGLVLEVKGNFCKQVKEELDHAGRGEDYIELGLGTPWSWNPLAVHWLDSYSLAYTIAALLNQLFGKGKEPFWQTASTNVIRNIIELHRLQGGQSWVTLQDVYRCAIDPELLEQRITGAETWARGRGGDEKWIRLGSAEMAAAAGALRAWSWETPANANGTYRTAWQAPLATRLEKLNLNFQVEHATGGGGEVTDRVAAVRRWYDKDWRQLDERLRTSIVEGISSFLALFDAPDVAAAFCPPAPVAAAPRLRRDEEEGGAARVVVRRQLPPLDEVIENGKVIALNMPAGANPALARAIGVLLKNAWLQTLLRRPSEMKQSPARYVRPAVFLCDEYQSFATVGEDDPSGDEKSFAMTRECRVIPIVATQSISSLRSVIAGQEAWRTLLQTLRTRVFLTLSDEASAEIAAKLCGQVPRMKASYSMSEHTGRAQVSWITARPGGGSGGMAASKSWREVREPMFHPRTFSLLGNCEAVCIPYDGEHAAPATRVYLKPYYLPRMRAFWRARAAGEL